jgi:hypothetical protein
VAEETTDTNNQFVSKLQDFYDTGQFQQKVSFWVSIVAVTIGFIVILFSIYIFLTNPEKIKESVLLGVAGVISEFIAAAFFYIHNKNLTQLNTYFEKLIKLQDTQLAISLVEKMNEKSHDYMYMSIINVLILRNEPNKELTPELVKALKQPDVKNS